MTDSTNSVPKMNVIISAMIVITLFVSDVSSQMGLKNPKPENLDDVFRYYKIVPNIIPYAPNDLLIVQYKEKDVSYGNGLYSIDQALKPKIAFNDSDDSREDDSLYTLMFVNLGYGNPYYLQWLVTNIVGDGYPTKGKQTIKYECHHHTIQPDYLKMLFLVYRQPTKTAINFDPSYFLGPDLDRSEFSILDFCTMYNLTDYPIAGNFFQLMPGNYYPDEIAPWMKPFINQWRVDQYRTEIPGE